MKRLLLSLSFLALGHACASAADTLYVVKVDSAAVYIDISVTTSTILQGSNFEVYKEGEELVNPVTGAHLGSLKTKVGAGSLVTVHDKYAEGKLTDGIGVVKPGHIARITSMPAPAAVKSDKTIAPLWQSPAINGQVTAMALCDADGDGKNELAAVLENSLLLYSIRDGKLAVVSSTTLPQMSRPISMEARDGKMLVTVYHSFLERFQTLVYVLKGDQLQRETELKWLVRSLKREGQPDKLVAQEQYADANANRSKIRPLFGEAEGWKTGDPIEFRKLDWVYGFNFLDVDGDKEDELVYVTETGKMRIQYRDKRYYEHGGEFASTPNRMNWHGKFLRFYPRVIVSRTQAGLPEACFLYNIPAAGVLADTFGRYNSAELACFAWTGTSLEQTWTAPLGGHAYDFDWGSFAGLPSGAVAVQIAGDKSFIVVLGR